MSWKILKMYYAFVDSYLLLKTRAIPERFCGGVSLRRGAISSACTFTLPFTFTVCHVYGIEIYGNSCNNISLN